MALSDSHIPNEQLLAADERARMRKELLEREAASEAARASEPFEYCDEAGNRWSCVLLDGSAVRIERCAPAEARLSLPSEIRGLPVSAVGPDALAGLADVEEVLFPDTVTTVGFCALRNCKNLRRVTFPAYLDEYDSNWVRNCAALEYLALPGALPLVEARVFDSPALRCVRVGAGTSGVAPGAFVKSALEVIEVDEANPFLSTDGRALYSADGAVLVALAVPGERYDVADACREIAKKGLSCFEGLREVRLPEGLRVVGDFAFSRTGVERFKAPASLERIGEKAFFACAALGEATLNEGLAAVGDNAFSSTAIGALRVPASVRELGHPLAAGTDVVWAGDKATFEVAEGSPWFEADGRGGLYRGAGATGGAASSGAFCRLIDPAATRYEVRAGTRVIEAGAFAGHRALEEAALPDGVEEVGAGAFRDCRALRAVRVPDTLRRVGDEAFFCTALESFRIPEGLVEIGLNALVTDGAFHGSAEPSLARVDVAAGNPVFYLAEGLLLRRKDGGRAEALLYLGQRETVRLPDEVDAIAPYAFHNTRRLRELHLSERVQDVGVQGLGVKCLIERLTIDLAEPLPDGRTCLEVRFPHTDRGEHQVKYALGTPRYVDVPSIFHAYDTAIANGHSFDAQEVAGLGLYEQGARILARLDDPVFLNEHDRNLFDRILSGNVVRLCVEAARHDDRRVVDGLLTYGYLDEGNLLDVIDAVDGVKDAAMTAYLLEIKRRRFGRAAIDFEL